MGGEEYVQGLYVHFDACAYAQDPTLTLDTGVSAFLQWGWVSRARNEVAAYLGGGLHMHGVIPGRREDDLGIAVANAATHVSSETTLEVTWRWVVMPWLAIQPSFQWIRHPGGDSALKSAKVGLL